MPNQRKAVLPDYMISADHADADDAVDLLQLLHGVGGGGVVQVQHGVGVLLTFHLVQGVIWWSPDVFAF